MRVWIVFAALASAVFFLVNVSLTGVALALAQNVPVVRFLRTEFDYQVLSSTTALG